MATIKLGKITLPYKGEYNGSTAYVKKDIVSYYNRYWIAIADVPTNQTPTIDFGDWNVSLSRTNFPKKIHNRNYWELFSADVTLGTISSPSFNLWTSAKTYYPGEIAYIDGAVYYSLTANQGATTDPRLNTYGDWELLLDGGPVRHHRKVTRLWGDQPPNWTGRPGHTLTWGAGKAWTGNIPWNIPAGHKKSEWNNSNDPSPAQIAGGGGPGIITWDGNVISYGGGLRGDGVYGYGTSPGPVERTLHHVQSHNAYIKSTYDFGSTQDIDPAILDKNFIVDFKDPTMGTMGAAFPRPLTVSANGAGGCVILMSDGTIQVHGYNDAGQYGAGDHTVEYGIGSNLTSDHFGGNRIVKLVCSGGHGSDGGSSTLMALDHNGEIWTWGENSNGQCGLGPELGRPGVGGHGYDDNTDVLQPTNLPSDEYFNGALVVDIFAGGADAAVMACLTSDGKLYTWGYNAEGALGYPTNVGFTNANACYVPKDIGVNWTTYGGIQKVIIAGGTSLTSLWVLDGQGNIWNCGYNGSSILGNGTATNTGNTGSIARRTTNWSIAGGIQNFWVTNTRGYNNAWFRYSNGSLYGNGHNAMYQLDTATNVNQPYPQPCNNVTNVVLVSGGGEDGTDTAPSLACLTDDGYVWYHGDNSNMEGGTGINGNNSTNVCRSRKTTENRWGWNQIPLPHSMMGKIVDVRAWTTYWATNDATPANRSVRGITVLTSDGVLGGSGSTTGYGTASSISNTRVSGGMAVNHYWGT